ncbi:MAG TPA: hypothetical protein PKD64_01450 [Pirellulaceae bacterium]|nr:hypothetical protein [Pirellulaceae bacterium]HMO90836.1 hypothetical protein [Pirellulaceae bacterium]HMP68087.1 hypothetical protein [Pirellulaceae bacterium]
MRFFDRNGIIGRWKSPLVLASVFALALGAVVCHNSGMARQQESSFVIDENDEEASPPPQRLSEFESSEFAWEFDPYQIKVWICSDQSSFLNAQARRLCDQVREELESMDPSGWRISVETAPHPWNWRLLLSHDLEAHTRTLVELPEIYAFDKFICVRVRHEFGRFSIQTQELDFRTQQWGAKDIRTVSNREVLAHSLSDSVAKAFMPLARIDKVWDKVISETKRIPNVVKLRARAAGLNQVLQQDESGNWVIVTNRFTPVAVRDEDVFMPVIRRLDRDNRLEAINRIHWTFLHITDISGTSIECNTLATGRAPLSGREGRRTQRFALVIRAPQRPTYLKLTSRDRDNPRPIPDLEIYSRPPNADTEEASEFLGTTDWRGIIKIPPNQDPMRVLYVKSGARPLARLPIIPGLYETISSPLPDDQLRLYAEGITQGLGFDLIDIAIQRKVLGFEIERSLRAGNFEAAQAAISELRSLPNSMLFNNRLNNELKRLNALDPTEAEKIAKMFNQLLEASNKELSTSEITLYQRKLAVARDGGDWQKETLDGILREQVAIEGVEGVIQ